MEIRPTPDQEAFIRQAFDAGRTARPEDAATQAMELWEERERRRAEILARVDEAEAALAQVGGTVITPETMRACRRREAQGPRPPGGGERHAPLMAHRLAPQASAELDDIWDYGDRHFTSGHVLFIWVRPSARLLNALSP